MSPGRRPPPRGPVGSDDPTLTDIRVDEPASVLLDEDINDRLEAGYVSHTYAKPVPRASLGQRFREWQRHYIPLPDQVIDGYLAEDEYVIHYDHPSFRAFIIQNIVQVVVLTTAGIWFLNSIRGGVHWDLQTALALLALDGVLAYLAYRRLEARYTNYVITNLRLIRLSGIIGRKLTSIAWTRLTGIGYEQKPLGRFLGYATIHLESANEESGLRRFSEINDPETFHKLLLDMVSGKTGQKEGETPPPPTKGERKSLRKRRREYLERLADERKSANARAMAKATPAPSRRPGGLRAQGRTRAVTAPTEAAAPDSDAAPGVDDGIGTGTATATGVETGPGTAAPPDAPSVAETPPVTDKAGAGEAMSPDDRGEWPPVTPPQGSRPIRRVPRGGLRSGSPLARGPEWERRPDDEGPEEPPPDGPIGGPSGPRRPPSRPPGGGAARRRRPETPDSEQASDAPGRPPRRRGRPDGSPAGPADRLRPPVGEDGVGPRDGLLEASATPEPPPAGETGEAREPAGATDRREPPVPGAAEEASSASDAPEAPPERLRPLADDERIGRSRGRRPGPDPDADSDAGGEPRSRRAPGSADRGPAARRPGGTGPGPAPGEASARPPSSERAAREPGSGARRSGGVRSPRLDPAGRSGGPGDRGPRSRPDIRAERPGGRRSAGGEAGRPPRRDTPPRGVTVDRGAADAEAPRRDAPRRQEPRPEGGPSDEPRRPWWRRSGRGWLGRLTGQSGPSDEPAPGRKRGWSLGTPADTSPLSPPSGTPTVPLSDQDDVSARDALASLGGRTHRVTRPSLRRRPRLPSFGQRSRPSTPPGRAGRSRSRRLSEPPELPPAPDDRDAEPPAPDEP